MWETWVQSLGWEDPLEKRKATLSSILAWRIPWTVWSMGSQRVRHDWVTFTSVYSRLLLCHFVTFFNSFWFSNFFLIFAYAVSPSNTLDQLGLVPGSTHCFKNSETRKRGYLQTGMEIFHYLTTLLGLPGAWAGKESACHVGDLVPIPGLGRSPGEEKGYPLQYSCLENSMDSSPRDLRESYMMEQLSLSVHIE